MRNVQDAHLRNYQLSKRREFAPWIIQQIREHCIRVLRVHVVGDFYDAKYTRKWQQVVRACRQTTFFAYTRSWHVPDYRAAVRELGRESNITLWLSSDRSMPKPPRWHGFPTCYLMVDDQDQPAYRADMVFRNDQTTVLKRTTNGSLVCAYDNGVTPITCSHCKLCWDQNYVHHRHPRSDKAAGRT